VGPLPLNCVIIIIIIIYLLKSTEQEDVHMINTIQYNTKFVKRHVAVASEATREQEQDKKGTENWRLHFFPIKKQKKTNTLDIKAKYRSDVIPTNKQVEVYKLLF